MIESRVRIKDIRDAKRAVEKLGGVFNGHYSYTDIVFKPGFEKGDIGKDVIRLRVLKINNRRTKNFILTHKIAEWTDKTKTDRIILREEFANIKEARDFMKVHYGSELKESYKYSREGWEYHLDRSKVFIETIEKIGPTIEVEAESRRELIN